ncbi:MAG: N-terminal methylation protein, partial [Actinobacteria bacterium]|nr:N-terminal methylation protein [Actinomycetota bacterium]
TGFARRGGPGLWSRKVVGGPAPRSRRLVGGPAPPSMKASEGFTLVEILLALGILATILAILLSAFTGAGRGLDILKERSGAFRQIRISADRIGTDLAGSFSSTSVTTTAFTCRLDQFSGKPASTLIFTAFVLPDPSAARPSTDIVKIKYYPKVGADGKYIDLYREQSDLPLIDNKMATSESRLATGLMGFRVETFDGKNWTTDWPPGGGTGTGRLPTKVAFVLTDARGQEYRRSFPIPLAGGEASTLFSGKREGRSR